ncbi:restriction endonuclease subunit S, partial [candidate division KSB1 bacterium]|nr:restriction endonuclease subunit S [candidate division KSB1 bacterium]
MISDKQLMKIRDLGRVITGKTPPTVRVEFFGTDFPFITPTDIKSFDVRYLSQTERYLSRQGYEFQKRYLLHRNTVCYVCIGSTIGKMCLVERESFTNQQINSIVVDEKQYNPIYVFYLLRTITPRIQAISGGSGAGKAILNKTSFEDIEIEVHSRPIQDKIAAILSAYDDLIENNTRRIKILEEMAQMIYREWFV